MRSFLEQMQRKFENFMVGRYGYDELSSAIMLTALIFLGLSLFVFRPFFTVLYLVCLILPLFRCFSKNIYKRSKELDKFQEILGHQRQFITRQKHMWRDRKTHRYFKCKCGAYLRVPKGKGKIDIRCRVCGEHMIRKT